MKKYYQVDIAEMGRVNTLIFKTKKAKNKWLKEYLTVGEFSMAFRKMYDEYLASQMVVSGKVLGFDEFLETFCKKTHLRISAKNFKTLLVREKSL